MEVEELIEPEVKEVLDDHKKILDKHEDDIQNLKIEAKLSQERYQNIASQLTRIENGTLATNATNSALLNSQKTMSETINKLIESNTTKDTNNTQVTTVQNNNRKDIAIKIIYVIAIIIVGLFALKGVTVSLPVF